MTALQLTEPQTRDCWATSKHGDRGSNMVIGLQLINMIGLQVINMVTGPQVINMLIGLQVYNMATGPKVLNMVIGLQVYKGAPVF